MPQIFLKPNSPDYDDVKRTTKTKACDMPGCSLHGEFRAPKDRSLNDYYDFCLEHVREYNSAWNFFEGMSETEIQSAAVNSIYGDRPTWRFDMEGAAAEAIRRKAWQTYHFTEEEPPKAYNTANNGDKANTPEFEALAVLDLAPPVTLDTIKLRYKMLAKKYHPDLNRGCKQSEELLKSVNMAYTILKIAYQKFEELPEKTP